jgi:hypothetical protein
LFMVFSDRVHSTLAINLCYYRIAYERVLLQTEMDGSLWTSVETHPAGGRIPCCDTSLLSRS